MLTSNFLGELSIQVLNSIKTCNSCDWQAGFTFAVMKSYWLCMVGGLFFLLVALEVHLSHSFGHIGDLRLKRIWHIFQVSSAKHLQQRHEYWHFQTMLQHSQFLINLRLEKGPNGEILKNPFFILVLVFEFFNLNVCYTIKIM